MRRKRSAADDRSESPTELIARISAEHGSPTEETGRHRRAAVVTTAAPESGSGSGSGSNRTLARRLAPLAAGAVVMLVAATIAAIVSPPTEQTVAGPELSSALVANDPAPLEIAPAAPSAGNTPTTTPAAPTITPKPEPKPKVRKPVPAPVKKAVAAATGGVQAAAAFGWSKIAGDEFGGSSLGSSWGAYDGAGNGGNGRRTPDAISVGNGMLTINGDSGGNSGGMAWNDNQTYGKWEVRARFPSGGGLYHPVLLLWPENGWPPEIDFAETTSDSNDVSFNLHFSSSNQQVSAQQNLDITQWHNYAVDWEPGSVTGYIDGKQWFQSTRSETIPDVPMHLAIQLDNFGGTSMQPAEMQVDYVRIYK
ncbi:MAG: hypothetical protein QOF00_1375 [Pseudonocardiales bacterium]|nr:hypothetical protein [Pseudonocardiales bacterium]